MRSLDSSGNLIDRREIKVLERRGSAVKWKGRGVCVYTHGDCASIAALLQAQ
jgi:hypothetical protein